MPLQSGGSAPYTSVTAAVAAVNAYRDRGLGTPITAEVLTRARISESIARRTLQSLRDLELIDENGQPTQQFEALRQARGEDEFRARLEEWLRGVYADVLQYANPSTDGLTQVQEAFRSYQPAGQREAMASLLVGLWQYAGLPVANGETDGPRSRALRATARQRPAHPSAPPAPRSRSLRTPNPAPEVESLPEGMVGFLREIPRGGQSWTSTRRSDFLKAFAVILDFYVPINDEPPAPDGGNGEVVS